MESKHLAMGIFLLLIGIARSDIAQERAECANQLVGLAPCLPYVGGTAKAPTLDCCTGLKQVLEKSKKCLCILIKDRDDPSLGLKINATLAATLPSACHAPANITQCIDLLHLAPSSPEAKVFAGFANITSSSSAPVASGNSTKSGSSAEDKSRGEIAKRSTYVGVEIICGFLLWAILYFGM
ncbi:hypothetical protein JCGZ_19217 [Jatropha curcas]|uniref:Bifunctional inhibitor/plant lipid transfer protein/seed storage helical domain-containing protein n=1 Tax=Jatropha curcas TaxID=180498 RepID=A0A067LIC6_JATCU|nr:protein YLS3 [Jatropha curcas]KDP44350.1 hypothetical protein JCGZ_19217 [Jatropha curcas]